MARETNRTNARRRRTEQAKPAATARRTYHQLRHPFGPQALWSDDRVEAVHQTSLRVLEELGIKVLLPEARQIFAKAGARVCEDTEFVWIGKDMVEEALRTAPKSIRMRAKNPNREQTYELGSMLFECGAGCPNSFDEVRGRISGSRETWRDSLKLQQHFDCMHLIGPSVEPQDVPINVRHLAFTEDQLLLTDKPTFIFSRSQGQVEDAFEMIRLANGLDEASWNDGVWATTIINTNSPRQIDRPMGQGIIDFARANQMSIITPFCLNGAMAPVTVAGALTLQHAESLAGITLAQMTNPGAPVSYGNFSSNVDLKSGAPAFGTPEHLAGNIASGQLARRIGLPWRSASGSASNTGDGQGVGENAMALWACAVAQATITVHSAGWLEGGLSFGFEKFIQDMENVQILADMAVNPAPVDDDAIGFDAIAQVEPGGHFFATDQTMKSFETAHYKPLIQNVTNYENWRDAGSPTSHERAVQKWQDIVNNAPQLPHVGDVAAKLTPFIERRTAEGGSFPMD